MNPEPRRRAGRVVLLDDQDAVLLLSGRDPSLPTANLFWFVPGGGAEGGEPVERAALREVYEEVGLVLQEADLGPVVWERRAAFPFDGRWFEQEERFWVVRTRHFRPLAMGLTDIEVRMGTEARWWPLAELSATTDDVYPPRLAELLATWVANGPPAVPVLID
jgi:8-oxo-dGTP pyrophosphatase MutT (NUDIX family)